MITSCSYNTGADRIVFLARIKFNMLLQTKINWFRSRPCSHIGISMKALFMGYVIINMIQRSPDISVFGNGRFKWAVTVLQLQVNCVVAASVLDDHAHW